MWHFSSRRSKLRFGPVSAACGHCRTTANPDRNTAVNRYAEAVRAPGRPAAAVAGRPAMRACAARRRRLEPATVF